MQKFIPPCLVYALNLLGFQEEWNVVKTGTCTVCSKGSTLKAKYFLMESCSWSMVSSSDDKLQPLCIFETFAHFSMPNYMWIASLNSFTVFTRLAI